MCTETGTLQLRFDAESTLPISYFVGAVTVNTTNSDDGAAASAAPAPCSTHTVIFPSKDVEDAIKARYATAMRTRKVRYGLWWRENRRRRTPHAANHGPHAPLDVQVRRGARVRGP